MDIIIGSAAGCIPLIFELYRTRRKVKLIGHSSTQAGAALCDSFEEINYHDQKENFEIIDKSISEVAGSVIYPGPHVPSKRRCGEHNRFQRNIRFD